MIIVKGIVVSCLFVAIFAMGTQKQPWYNTVEEMKDILNLETNLVGIVQKQIEIQKDKLEKTKEDLQGMKNFSMGILKELNESFNHPIEHFRMLKRYQERWEKFLPISKVFQDIGLSATLVDVMKIFPQPKDKEVVLDELLRLQKIYKLKTKDLARGKLDGEYCGSKLTANECVYLGTKACSNGELSTCVEWMDRAIQLVKIGKQCTYTLQALEKYVQLYKNEKAFLEICNGSDNSSLQKNLKCFLWDNHREPWLVLQPVKMEYLSISPDIVRFYEVLSDKEIEILKALAEPRLGRAEVSGKQNPLEPTSSRVAHNCWLKDEENATVKKITDRISKLTGLTIKRNAEELQVATYGISGHYNFHHDWFHENETYQLKHPDRKATFMFYLSDVAIGGHTAFIHPKISAKPIKGSAIFWHNLLNSGLGDTRTRHAACPVVKGTKWIANKWIWETKEDVCKLKEYIGRLH